MDTGWFSDGSAFALVSAIAQELSVPFYLLGIGLAVRRVLRAEPHTRTRSFRIRRSQPSA